MVSLITSPNAHCLIPPVVSYRELGIHFKFRPRVAIMVVKRDRFLGYKELEKTRRTRSGFLCKGSMEFEGELVLEKKIMEFMKNSKTPDEFPTKKDLLDAGRVDLVNAIIKKGGWLSLGWDDSDDECELEKNDFDDIRDLQTRFESFQRSNDDYESSLSSCSSSHQSASPSGRSLDIGSDEDTGIEGILSRLEKHRSLSFGISMRKNRYDAESCYGEKPKSGEDEEFKYNKMLAIQQDGVVQEGDKEIKSDQIKSRLQQMQLELSSAIHSLRSKSEMLDSEGHESMPSNLQKLSDVWEFHEDKFMNAKDKLRSLRAKLAVIEGKMALSIIDAQKMVEEKQRRIESARKTLQLLRSTSVVWPNSGSEVLLVGSFDGWTTQRKMEKSRTGIFSVSLKLYPGRYEIKFIVDGVWKTDPLRPTVQNNGYENNILIIV